MRSCNPLAVKCLEVQQSAQCKTETGLELESGRVPGMPELRKAPVTVIGSKMGHRINQENQLMRAVRWVTGGRQPSEIWAEQEPWISSSPTKSDL